jgi:hypothetical protein
VQRSVLTTAHVSAGLSRMAPDYSSSVGTVVAADEQLTDAALSAAPTRSTKLLQLNIANTHLLYDPGGQCLHHSWQYRLLLLLPVHGPASIEQLVSRDS